MMDEELGVNEMELRQEIAFGMRLKQLIGNPGEQQQQTIQKNRDAIFDLLNETEVFEGLSHPLDDIGSYAPDGQNVPPVAHYVSKDGNHSFVLLLTDAKPEIVSTAISLLPDKLAASRKTVVFLGLQDPELDRAKMNDAVKHRLGERSKVPSRLIMPWRYLQVYDILTKLPKTSTFGPPSFVVHPRDTSLLVGNGLNQLNNHDRSWTDILKHLVTVNIPAVGQAEATDFVDDRTIPSPMKFEYLATHSGGSSIGANAFGKLKDDIASLMVVGASGLSLPPDSIRALLTGRRVDNLLTTNYDLVLERCFSAPMRPVSETKYILLPTTYGAGEVPSIYHVHGIAGVGRNSTICLGYEHYMGYIQRLRSRLIKDQRRRESAKRIVFLLLGIVPPSLTWEELFFTTDMYIVGLGLDFEEMDLWELLTLRAAVLKTSSTLQRLGLPEESYTNAIVYYDIEAPCDSSEYDDKSKEYTDVAKRIRHLATPVMDDNYWLPIPSKKGKAKSLKGLGVEVKVVHTDNYERGYEMILQDIAARP